MEEDILLEGVLLKTRSSFVPVAQRDGLQRIHASIPQSSQRNRPCFQREDILEIRLHNLSTIATLHFGGLS
jgi:hypothetical protein